MQSSSRYSPPGGAPVIRLSAALIGTALLLHGGGHAPRLEASEPTVFEDRDHDGLSDAFETYLSVASFAAELATTPVNGDTDGDGQLDGFEYCLSQGQSIVSPGFVYPVVPQVTIGSRQDGDSLVLSIYIIPGSVSDFDDFRFLVAVPGPGDEPILLDMTELLALNTESVTVIEAGGHEMGVLQVRIPVSTIGGFGSFAVAALGEIGTYKTGDSATYTVSNGNVSRWVHTFAGGGEPGGPGDPESGEAEEQPQGTEVEVEALPGQYCGSSVTKVPTAVDGVVKTVPIPGTTGCKSGSWTCVPANCTPGSPAGQQKVVLDVARLMG